jgi:crotonobetainyl-CoA:carnitine CoA-transferase CaiB-like acyl-CoA transferase
MSRSRVAIDKSAPPLGGHTDEILATLGFNLDERQALYDVGATATDAKEEIK